MLRIVSLLFILGCSTVLAADDPCDLPTFCTPSQVLGCLNSVDFGSNYYKEALDDIIKLVEPYVFLDILKNPPQPNGFSNYFKPVDLIAELRKVKTEDTNFYEFYRSVQKALFSVQDGHFSFNFPGNNDYDTKLTDFSFTLPLKLIIDINDNNEPRMKGVLLDINAGKIYDFFPNGSATKEIIERNRNNFITSINGMSPFDFVLNYGSEFYNYLKNKDAKYTYASRVLSVRPMLSAFPMLEKDFSNLTVVYSNGESFTSDIYLYNNKKAVSTKIRSDVGSLKEFAREMLKNSDGIKVIDFNDIINAYNNGEKPWTKKRLTEKDAIQALKNFDFEKVIQAKNKVKKASKRAVETMTNAVTWDFSTSDSKLKCRVDDKNKVNVFFINSFNPNDEDDFVGILVSCRFTFEENDYPIVVIDDNNGGGSMLLSAVFQESLQPDMTARILMSYKNDERVHKRLQGFAEGGVLQNPATGKTFTTVEELMKGAEVDDFGNGVNHSRSKPALILYLSIRQNLDKEKPKLKRNRKPTDILVFTDSYSFSAGSIFTKGLKEAGSAIIVGYNGYPGSKKETFDIGQAPTNNWGDDLDLLGKNEYNRLYEKGIIYGSISAGESYRLSDIDNGVKPLVPREFLFDAPDERVAIYSAYSDDKYDVFMEAAKGVLEKYKTECNPDNLGLHMKASECDAKINKAHMHGGYVCGADGKWSTKCEGYYCDDGYYFNTKTKECAVDLFYNNGGSSSLPSSSSSQSSSMNSSSTITISFWAILLVLVCALF